MPLLKNLKTNETLDIARKPVVIGRHSGDDLTVNDPKCSRGNSEIEFKNGKYYIRDRGSRNGTTVNGVLITEQVLLNYGDKITIGATDLEFQKTPEKIDIKLTGYDIIEHTASGGMGKVYRARQMSLDRIVAIKVLSPKFANDSRFTENFINEARAAGRLNHPNLVQVHDVNKEFQPNGQVTYYFTMEFIDGKTIKEMIRDVGKMPWKKTLDILADACRGLIYIHDSKLVHRDIKPDNLMIDADGKVKIADLGIALDVTESDGQEATEDGSRKIVGTPHYISPEQAKGKSVDLRSDLYSLGATAYHMLTGETPFDGENSKDIIKKHVHETPRQVNELNPEVPTLLNDLIFKLMSKDPNDRVQTTNELLAELEAISAKFEKVKTRTKSVRSKSRKFKLFRYLSASVIGVTLALTVYYFYMKPQSQNPTVKKDPASSTQITTNKQPSSETKEKYRSADDFKSQNQFDKALAIYKELLQTNNNPDDTASIEALIKRTEQQKATYENQVSQNQIDEEYKKLISFRESNKDNLVVIRDEYKKFINKYPKSEQAIAINNEIRNLTSALEIEQENKRFKEFITLYQSIHTDSEKLKILQDNKGQFKLKESQDWFNLKESEINERSKQIIETAKTNARNLESNIANEDFALAMQRAKSYLSTYDNPNARKILEDKIKEIEQKALEYTNKLTADAHQLFRDFSFSEAINFMEAKATKLRETSAINLLNKEVAKLKSTKTFFEDSIRLINEKSPISLSYTETHGVYEVTGNVISADSRSVNIEINHPRNGISKVPKTWAKMELPKIYLILESVQKLCDDFEDKKTDLQNFSTIFKIDQKEIDQLRLH